MKLNKIDEVWNSANPLLKFLFGLLSFRNFAPKTTWRNDFSSLLLTLNISEAPTCDISGYFYQLGFAFFERTVKRMHIFKYLTQNDMPRAYQSPLKMLMLGGLRKSS